METKLDAGTKIILLASVIALLIAITGFFSIDRAKKMKEEFFQLVGEDLPLSMALSRVLALQTGQVDLLEQTAPQEGKTSLREHGALAGLRASFARLDRQVEEALQDAGNAAGKMTRDTDPPAARGQEPRIRRQLSEIARQQSDYEERSLRLLDRLEAGEDETLPAQTQEAREMGAALLTLTERLLKEQEEFTTLAADAVMSHQRSVLHVILGITTLTYAIGVFLLLRILNVVEERRHAESQLKFMARHDPLSGLFNRRQFMNQLEMFVAAAHRYEHPVSLCICDLDDFKKVNDTYGHRAGDEVIKQFGKLILQEIRVDDFAGRYGGDEFCIALNHTPAESAREVLERIRVQLEGLAFRDDGGAYFQVSATFGVADLDKDRPSKDVLIESADEVLYEAKNAGRNHVVIREAPDSSGGDKPA